MKMFLNTHRSTGRLVPVFVAHEEENGKFLAVNTTLALAKAAAARGETVLMLDILGGDLMQAAGIIHGVTLADVLYRGADIGDAKYISHNEHFTVAHAGDAPLEDLLGSLAAMSLSYDWVFVGTEVGCTPAHVCLAGASDTAILGYASQKNLFMRAYWMLDAIRARVPKFDPLMLVEGDETDGFETYDLFAGTVREFLGAAPALGGITQNARDTHLIAPTLLACLREEALEQRRTA